MAGLIDVIYRQKGNAYHIAFIYALSANLFLVDTRINLIDGRLPHVHKIGAV